MIDLRSVFADLGLPEDWAASSDELPAYRISWPGVQVTANRVTTEYLEPVWLFTGHFQDTRRIGWVEFRMPVEVESRQQAIAWLADRFIHQDRVANPPAWLLDGMAWRDQLPWVRRQIAYTARERCSVDRDWFRQPCKRMRQWGESSDADATASFYFDGEVLRISGPDELLAMPALGEKWAAPVSVEADGLRHLPKRLVRPAQDVSIWEGHLNISQLTLPLVDKADNE